MKDEESHPEKESNETFFKILLFELQKEETRSSSTPGTGPKQDRNSSRTVRPCPDGTCWAGSVPYRL